MTSNRPVTPQTVGAYGEKAVEAELLRRGWIPSNVNASVKNAAEFDVIAQKASRVALLRVKTSGPGQRAFQFSIKPGKKFDAVRCRDNDVTIFVSMGITRQQDEFYVVPTGRVRQSLNDHIDEYLSHKTGKGEPRKDTGQWTLHLDPLKRGPDRHSRGYKNKWSLCRDGWALLDQVAL